MTAALRLLRPEPTTRYGAQLDVHPALAVACGTCHRPVDRPCRGGNGHVLRTPHARRVKDWNEVVYAARVAAEDAELSYHAEQAFPQLVRELDHWERTEEWPAP